MWLVVVGIVIGFMITFISVSVTLLLSERFGSSIVNCTLARLDAEIDMSRWTKNIEK